MYAHSKEFAIINKSSSDQALASEVHWGLRRTNLPKFLHILGCVLEFTSGADPRTSGACPGTSSAPMLAEKFGGGNGALGHGGGSGFG